MTGSAKLVSTAVLFAVTPGLLALAAATHSAVPLFFMWVPLLAVPWILVRPEPAGSTPNPPPETEESA